MTKATKKPFTKGEFLPLPEGDYLVRMQLSKKDDSPAIYEQETKSGKGVQLKTTLQVVNGEYKNRLIFCDFLVEHTSEKAAQIGQERLDKYLKAVGVEGGLEEIGYDRTRIEDYAERLLVVTLAIEEGNEYVNHTGKVVQGKPKNVVKAFKAR